MRRPDVRHCLLVSMLALVALVPATPSIAFERDSHYYLRYALSLATCFDWDESHLIASGDWGMDENKATHAEMNPVQRKNKINWHAFGHSDARFHELWQRTLDQEDLDVRLVELGQFMHFLEDWESHAGFGVRMGHARATFAGRDPDSLGSSEISNRRMVQSALDHLLETCADLGRMGDAPDVDRALARMMNTIDRDGILVDLFENSDPAWKKGKAGGFRKHAGEILQANKARIEQAILIYMKPLPYKNVPDDFEPGHPERGLPPSLGLTFDRTGNVLDVADSVAEVIAAYERAGDLAPDLTVDLTRAAAKKKAWRVDVTVANAGEEDTAAGSTLEVAVVDSSKEEVLARSTETLPALAVGERTEVRLKIPAVGGQASSDVIYGAWIGVEGDDDWLDNTDWLMSSDVAEDEPKVTLLDDLDDTGAIETLRFISEPRLVVFDADGCLVFTAMAPEGDTPAKLGETRLSLVSGDGKVEHALRTVPPWWSAIATPEGKVGGKLVACYTPGPEQCAAWGNVENPRLRIEISMLDDGVEPVSELLPVEESVRRRALELCDPFGMVRAATP